MKKENKAKIDALKKAKNQLNGDQGLANDDAFDSVPATSIQTMGKRNGRGLEDIEEQSEDIKDKDAYRLWRRLKALPILNEDMIISCSDGTKVNLAWFPKLVESRTSHLSVEERTHIQDKKLIYHQTALKAMQAKQKAYGNDPLRKARLAMAEKSREMGFLKARKAQIIELFGRMFSVTEVHKIIVEDWNHPVSLQEVIDFKRNNLSIISEKQEIHKREHSDLRLVHKRSRLEELTQLYNRFVDKIKVTMNREDARMMKELLVEIRREIEGERVTINGKLDLNIEADINQHLQKEVFKEFSLTQIIVGRAASRMRVHSSRIIQGLQNSYYARFNKFLGAEPEDIDWEEIDYPSAMGFDFEKIAMKYKEKETISAREIAALKQGETDIQLKMAQGGLKEALQRIIAERTGDVKRDKLHIDQSELSKLKDEAAKSASSLRNKKE